MGGIGYYCSEMFYKPVRRYVHMGEKGLLGGLFDNDTILWFIILFLLLFWGLGGYGIGDGGYKE